LFKHIHVCKLEGRTKEAKALLADRGDLWEVIYHARIKGGGYAMYNEDNVHHKRWSTFKDTEFKIIEVLEVIAVEQLR